MLEMFKSVDGSESTWLIEVSVSTPSLGVDLERAMILTTDLWEQD
jgi:hypothetical protein